MCSRITCDTCNKPSYAGCGAHVEMVLGDVPKSERCKCREEKAKGKQEGSASILDKIFGR